MDKVQEPSGTPTLWRFIAAWTTSSRDPESPRIRLVADRDSEKGVGLTYSGISVLDPGLFKYCPSGPFPLRQPLIDAMNDGSVSGQFFQGAWTDVGTPERLELLEQEVLERR